jgi:hypothetical protein
LDPTSTWTTLGSKYGLCSLIETSIVTSCFSGGSVVVA